MHFLIKAPESSDCILRAPFVADPTITQRRLAAGLQSVYSALPCYTTLEQQAWMCAERDAMSIAAIDVEVRKCMTRAAGVALPSPLAMLLLTLRPRLQLWEKLDRKCLADVKK